MVLVNEMMIIVFWIFNVKTPQLLIQRGNPQLTYLSVTAPLLVLPFKQHNSFKPNNTTFFKLHVEF